jgi:hypothetical protein
VDATLLRVENTAITSEEHREKWRTLYRKGKVIRRLPVSQLKEEAKKVEVFPLCNVSYCYYCKSNIHHIYPKTELWCIWRWLCLRGCDACFLVYKHLITSIKLQIIV